MTDEEFDKKVTQLRAEFSNSMYSIVGGTEVFMTKDDQEFLDAFSIATYAGWSVLATLAGAMMTRYALISGVSEKDAIGGTDVLFHEFLHEAMDKAQENFAENVRKYNIIKNSN